MLTWLTNFKNFIYKLLFGTPEEQEFMNSIDDEDSWSKRITFQPNSRIVGPLKESPIEEEQAPKKVKRIAKVKKPTKSKRAPRKKSKEN